MSEEALTVERSAANRSEMQLGEESLLTDEFVRQLIDVGETDVLIGLPTHNNAKTIGSVIEAIQETILQWFPRERVAIINADAGSRDGTPELIVSASIDDVRRRSFNRFALRTLHAISTQYGTTIARGTALRTILAASELLRARACAVISPETNELTPDGLRALLQPVCRDECDLVLPTYARHKFEGLLITNLLYPMTRALYGVRIREPYASEFAISGRLGSQFLAQASWNDDAARAGCEVLLTTASITSGARMCQAFMGPKPRLEHRAADLVPALRQTIGVLFASMESTFASWSGKTGSQAIPTSGSEQHFTIDPIRVNRKRLRDMFSTGVGELQSVYQSVLSPATMLDLRRIAAAPEEEVDYNAELWARTVYEFAAAYHKSVMNRDHIIQALAPLFRGRAFAFLAENRNSSASEVEDKVEDLCLTFESLKPYLLEIWNGKK